MIPKAASGGCQAGHVRPAYHPGFVETQMPEPGSSMLD